MARRWCLVLPLALVLGPLGPAPEQAPGSASVRVVRSAGQIAPRPTGPALAPAAGTFDPLSAAWAWPVVGPVIRPFDPPEDPYGSGHRGIDIAVPLGTTVHAPAAGTVTFAGKVGGQLFVTLDHGGGLVSTYSWLSAALVHKGDVVAPGAPIALSGQGHPGSTTPHLHLGVKRDGAYIDPLEVLGPPPVSMLVHLAQIPTPGNA
jgi:murein DD-endopeptidase MepM/ murein hydrolase activator NlpD